MQHGSTDRYSAGRQFQSSPARGGRCNSSSQASCATVSRSFNPHPPVGAGATVRRPQRRARRLCFNPHPPVGAGATLRARSKPSRTSSFQSSPARGGGCNTVYDGYRFRSRLVSILTRPWGRVQPKQQVARAEAVGVSILTRPWGRVQLGVRIGARLASRRFNPHPPVGAGATRAGCTGCDAWASGFNPHPPVGAGATHAAQGKPHAVRVSILTRPWERVQLGVLARFYGVRFLVSILTRPWGRVQHQIARNENIPFSVSILTRPWGRVQRG